MSEFITFSSHLSSCEPFDEGLMGKLVEKEKSVENMPDGCISSYLKYCREDERLKTFDNWPLDWLDKRQLAKSGFLYTNEKDSVRCHFCNVVLALWEPGDQPEIEHLRWSPNCPLLHRRTGDNVPINRNAINSEGNSTNTTSSPTEEHFVQDWNRKYRYEEERLKTFDNWPLDWLDKHQLAQMGMFYTNEDDIVRCFFCDQHMSHWQQNDQPVAKHLRWSPNCPLLRRRPTNNIPLNSEDLDRILPPLRYDICGSPLEVSKSRKM